MARQEIPIAKLLVDLQNPRLADIQPSQREAIRTLAQIQGPKMIALAEHIVKNGPNLSELPIVTPTSAKSDEYVVLDGNRRLATIKALESPDLVVGVLTELDLRKLKNLSALYILRPVEEILCLVVKSRAEADTWIQLKHRGQSDGAGLVPWNGAQGAVYDARRGKPSLHLELLALAEEYGNLSAQVKAELPTFPVSTLERLVNDPNVRNRLGFDIKKGRILTKYPKRELAKGLARVITDLALGTKTVSDVKRQPQRLKYVRSIPAHDLPDFKTEGDLRPLSEQDVQRAAAKTKPIAKKRPTAKAERDTLIPKECRLLVPDGRIKDAFGEMRKLFPEDAKNICGVMLRVFMEWSIEAYIDRHRLRGQLSSGQKKTLHGRVLFVLDHLEKSGKITAGELKPIQVEMTIRHSLLSMETLNAYVHEVKMKPKPSELKTTWDRMQPVMEHIWC